MMRVRDSCDIAIVGGGLAGGLLAYALSVRRPELRLALIEPQERFGGNHVWSFFSTDIAAEDRWIIDPFVDHCWHGYEVRFPDYRRQLGAQYNSIRSDSFDARLRSLLPAGVPVRAAASGLSPTTIVFDGQRRMTPRAVIDARGPSKTALLDTGWQKFMGLEVRTRRPHGLTAPIVMDATVPQVDGFRFVYVLPFAEDRLFIEDTYYSDDAKVAEAVLKQRILAYAEAQRWDVEEIIGTETGALPVTLGGNFEAYWQSGGTAAKIGMRAGLFHPATGYSLPDAVRTAAKITAMTNVSGAAIEGAMHAHAAAAWKAAGFYRMLNRMAFRAAVSEERFRIYQRFYRLRPPLIERFYAGRSTRIDKARILAGKPPVPIGRALKVFREEMK